MASSKVTVKDNGFNAFFAKTKDLQGRRVKIGIQGREAAQIRPGGISMVDLAVIHEFGAPNANIPQRSFLRSTVDMNEKKYQRMMARAVRKLVKKPKAFKANTELLKQGETVRGDIIKRMKDAEIKQDLAESTKKRRGEEGPALIDTGLLLASISVVIK